MVDVDINSPVTELSFLVDFYHYKVNYFNVYLAFLILNTV